MPAFGHTSSAPMTTGSIVATCTPSPKQSELISPLIAVVIDPLAMVWVMKKSVKSTSKLVMISSLTPAGGTSAGLGPVSENPTEPLNLKRYESGTQSALYVTISIVTLVSKNVTPTAKPEEESPSNESMLPKAVRLSVPTRHDAGGGMPIAIRPDRTALDLTVKSMNASRKAISSGMVPPGSSVLPT